MENSDYYYRKYKKYKMLYKKVGGGGMMDRARAHVQSKLNEKRAQGRRLLNRGIRQISVNIENQLDEIEKNEDLLAQISKNRQMRLLIVNFRKALDDIKINIGATTERLDVPKDQRNYKAMLNSIHRALMKLHGTIIPNLKYQYHFEESEKKEGQEVVAQASGRPERVEEKGLMEEDQAGLLAIAKSFQLIQAMIEKEFPFLLEELNKRQRDQ